MKRLDIEPCLFCAAMLVSPWTWKWYRGLPQAGKIKQLYEPLVGHSGLSSSKSLVLVENWWQAPSLQSS